MTRDFRGRLTSGPPLILDGATGTELLRRGYRTTLPLWSAGALTTRPDLVSQIHSDYARAGADIITANTFRTNARTLKKAGLGARFEELNRLAVDLARRSGAPFVAGSIAPIEDCYRPDLAPPHAQAVDEHARLAATLADAGCDLLLIETMNTIDEASAAVEGARSTGLPLVAGFVCREDGRLLSGESAEVAARTLTQLGVCALAVNCTPIRGIDAVLRELRRGTSLPLGAYANVGAEDSVVGWRLTDDVGAAPYALAAAGWSALGARIIGGCCGTTPEHVAALAQRLRV